MINESLRNARKDAGLSQEEMAHKIGVSQQTYSRIEAGVGTVKPRKATMLAEILNTTVEALFPTLVNLTRENLKSMTDDFSSAGLVVVEEFERAGIDIDENDRTIYWSRAGAGTHLARVSGATARRILRELEYPQSSDFVVFDTGTHRVALRMDAHVVKVASRSTGDASDSYEISTLGQRGDVLEVWREGGSYPDELSVQNDSRPIGYTSDWALEHQVQHLFQEIWNKSPRVRVVSRVDQEVEAVFYPKNSIVSLVAPLAMLGPKE